MLIRMLVWKSGGLILSPVKIPKQQERCKSYTNSILKIYKIKDGSYSQANFNKIHLCFKIKTDFVLLKGIYHYWPKKCKI